MKKRTASLLSAYFCAAASVVTAGDFKSVIITSISPPLTFNVADGHFLRIRNFTQEGGSQRGLVSVTTNGQTKNVLAAALIDQGPFTNPPASASTPPEIIKGIMIAGPAQITIAPVSGATLFITYKRRPDLIDAITNPTPTPTTTPSPTPTPMAARIPIAPVFAPMLWFAEEADSSIPTTPFIPDSVSTPTPSPLLVASPTPTASPTPMASPTPTVSPTQTASPTSTPTPSLEGMP